MRFPISLTRSLASYLLRKKLANETKYPLVLMLEPLHACNLACGGCGRIREYADTISQRLSVEQCLAALDACGAPVVSICGGEPLIYPEITELIDAILARRKHIYLCTNGLLLEKKIAELNPRKRLFINVHLDGLDDTHDRQAGQKGVFAAAVRGIAAAKSAGLKVYTNTTIYATTDMHEIAVLFAYLEELGVDGLMISPAYGYQAVEKSNPGRSGQIFMARWQVHEKFCRARQMLGQFRLTASPIYLDFLCGRRELPCAAWANPTYNVRGWRGPCYLVGDAHYATYPEFLAATDWRHLGPGNDPRCEHCLVHCGFEPSAVLTSNRRLRDVLQMAVWQMT
jgi:hopanoid biosynthesis associated radical SAM protein HpnH